MTFRSFGRIESLCKGPAFQNSSLRIVVEERMKISSDFAVFGFGQMIRQKFVQRRTSKTEYIYAEEIKLKVEV